MQPNPERVEELFFKSVDAELLPAEQTEFMQLLSSSLDCSNHKAHITPAAMKKFRDEMFGREPSFSVFVFGALMYHLVNESCGACSSMVIGLHQS